MLRQSIPNKYIPRENARAVISTRQAWQFRCLPMNIEGDTLVIATTRKHLHRALKFATRVLRNACVLCLYI